MLTFLRMDNLTYSLTCKMFAFSVTVLLASICGCQSREYGRVPCSEFPNTYTLSNGCVELTVAPQIGRIIGYRRIDGQNLLWMNMGPMSHETGNEWYDYGGEKIWLAPKGLWQDILGRTWPPETTIDGAPWNVTFASARKLVMVSKVSTAHAARVTRTITLPDDGTTVRIDNHLERTQNSPHPVQIWTIAQVLLPEMALLSISDEKHAEIAILENSKKGVVLEKNIDLKYAQLIWPADASTKVGTFGQWVAAVYFDDIFVQYAEFDKSAKYYDKASCEIYANPKLKYIELELLSPTEYLSTGRMRNFTITWKLLRNHGHAKVVEVVNNIEKANPVKNHD